MSLMACRRGVPRLVVLCLGCNLMTGLVSSFAGKIDMVKSKWGLALAAVVTVLSSLLMSVGLCTLFGLTPTLNGGSVCTRSPTLEKVVVISENRRT